ANRGIGWALAQALARKGAYLILLNRTTLGEKLNLLTQQGATGIEEFLIDFSQPHEINHFLQQWGSRPFDVLINNAGQLTGGPLLDQPFLEIQQMLAVNLNATIQLTQGLLPILIQQKSGKLVMNASVSAVMYFPFASTYAASKAAIMALTYSLRAELKGSGVSTLLLFTPGIRTRMFNEIETKYGKHLDVSQLPTLSADEYAQIVVSKIEADEEEYLPRGSTGWVFRLARSWPSLFAQLITFKSKKNKGEE
nr:SDR family NAD(P)-dependent oxidoreductase [Pseudobdellovibrionaceae bacterium]